MLTQQYILLHTRVPKACLTADIIVFKLKNYLSTWKGAEKKSIYLSKA